MTVAVSAGRARGALTRAVRLERAGRVLLVTDKPLYQPRQTIHLRALALSAHDLRPLAAQRLRFEIKDPKGNKVFKQVRRTSRHGVAATTFQLADEITLGSYQIEVAPLNKGVAAAGVKTVLVKRYVLPKFKVSVATDKRYYLPRQTVRATVRARYFFGKPVAGARVKVVASTFDGTAFRRFSTLDGRTGADGSWKLSAALPSYFVGQPLLRGNALVKLDVRVTDSARHTQLSTRSLPVAAAPIKLLAIPEAGRLVLGVPNRIYLAATYPDGSPARATVTARRRGHQIASVKTDASGIAELTITPRASALRRGRWRSRRRRGRHVGYVADRVLRLSLAARDARGNSARLDTTFSAQPQRDRLLLRTDKAIYRAGDLLRAQVLSAGRGADTLYLDVVKNRQTVLTRALRSRRGRATLKLPLGRDLVGTVELHAYKIQSDGEIVRDARVLYVQPAAELKVAAIPNKKVYRPGERALIRFRVTDAAGAPRAAAIGVIVVDEAVYALQEMKPGLEKIFFTLERELARPRGHVELAAVGDLPDLVRRRRLAARRQRVAKVLLATAKPRGRPALWQNPVAARMQRAQRDHFALRDAIRKGLRRLALVRRDRRGRWRYRRDLVARLLKAGLLPAKHARDPLGARYTPRSIARLWPELAASRYVGQIELGGLWRLRERVRRHLARRTRDLRRLRGRSLASHLRRSFRAVCRRQPALAKDPAGKRYRWWRVGRLPGFRPADFAAEWHSGRASSIYHALGRYARRLLRRGPRSRYFDKRRQSYRLPTHAVQLAVRRRLLSRRYARDLWGRTFRLRRRARPIPRFYYDRRLRHYALLSAGPDRTFGTADDLAYAPGQARPYQLMARALGVRYQGGLGNRWGLGGLALVGRGRGGGGVGTLDAMGGAIGAGPRGRRAKLRAATDRDASARHGAPKKRQVRVRSYFPETLLFKPALLTDGKGRAQLELKLADSITTWRMTASANSADGQLGGTSRGLRVFQDFFVDLDLPASLTQNDEVSLPVVVYNYLKRPQRVRLELARGSWFSLAGSRVQELTLKPAEVAATYYRIKVRGLGRRTLQVRADGSAMSDAIRREIEVRPDGEERNLVTSGRLAGTVTKALRIPKGAVAGASKILVRLYPGVFSQVMEGMDSLLRLPGG